MYTFVTFLNNRFLDKRFDEHSVSVTLKEFLGEYGIVHDLKMQKLQNQERLIIFIDMILKEEVNDFFSKLRSNPKYGEKAYITTRFSSRLNQNLRIKLNLRRDKYDSATIEEEEESIPYRPEEYKETLYRKENDSPGNNIRSSYKNLTINIESGSKRNREERPEWDPIEPPSSDERVSASSFHLTHPEKRMNNDPFPQISEINLPDTNCRLINIKYCQYPLMCLVKRGENTNLIQFAMENEVLNFLDIFNDVTLTIIDLRDTTIFSFPQYVRYTCFNYKN